MFLGGRSDAIIPPHEKCKLVHVDIDGSEIGRTLPVDLGVVSDARHFVKAVNDHIGGASLSNIDKHWVKQVIDIQKMPSPYESHPETTPSGQMHPYHALNQLFASLPKDPILILDGGECALWASESAHLCSPSSILKSTGSLGFLGNGFGYALGAAIAAPEHKVINIQGDGSSGFHFMELDAYARHGVDVLTVVVNNHCWGMSFNGQDLVYGDADPARPVSALSSGTGYDAVSGGLGNRSVKVTTVEDVQTAIRDLVEDGPGAACVELVVDRKPVHPVTEAMVGRTEDENTVVVPYYDNIPRAYYKSN